jgi:hypothetical protein
MSFKVEVTESDIAILRLKRDEIELPKTDGISTGRTSPPQVADYDTQTKPLEKARLFLKAFYVFGFCLCYYHGELL